jgi:hypothetical protein
MDESLLNHMRQRSEQFDIKKTEEKNTGLYWKLTAVLFLMIVIGVGAMSKRGREILVQMIEPLPAASSETSSKQVETEQAQAPPPVVQTEEKKSTSFDSIQPEEAKKKKNSLPKEEKEAFKSVIVKEESKEIYIAMKKNFQSDWFLAILSLTGVALTGSVGSWYPLANMTGIALVGLAGFLMTMK